MIKSLFELNQNDMGIKNSMKMIFLLTLSLTSCQLFAQQVVNLYPGAAPGSENWNWEEKEFFVKTPMNANVFYNVSKPTLTVFLPDRATANGTAVLLIPGGGFRIVNMEQEGYKLAKELNAKGYTAFVLKYRVERSLSNDPFNELMKAMSDSSWRNKQESIIELALSDAKIAMKHIREHANKYGIQPGKIGMAGFSAGGTLALRLATNEVADTRPDFVALIYTVFNPEKTSISPTAPPAFIASASDDKLATSMNSINMYNNWMKGNKNTELHIYATGGHGLRAGNAASWIYRFMDWMKLNGY